MGTLVVAVDLVSLIHHNVMRVLVVMEQGQMVSLKQELLRELVGQLL